MLFLKRKNKQEMRKFLFFWADLFKRDEDFLKKSLGKMMYLKKEIIK